MKKKHLVVLIGLLVISMVLLPVIGCDGDDSSGDSDGTGQNVTKENVTELVREALIGLNTYEIEMELTMNIEGEVGDEKGEVTISVKADGAMDLAAKRSRTDMAMSLKMRAEGESMDENMRMSAYIIDDTYYLGTSEGSGSMRWDTQSAPSYLWDQQEQTNQLLTLLENSNISYLKTEKVQGVQCYLIEVDADLDTLWDFVLGQSGEFTQGMGLDFMEGSLKKVTVKYWFDRDTLFFRKIYVYIDMELDEEQLGEEGEIRFITEMTTDFHKHNSSVDITLPEEAENSW